MTAASPNLVSLLQQRVQEHPDRFAYVFLSGEDLRQAPLTYAELDTQARAIGAVLRQLKVQGERALLLYPPGLEFIAAFFGCLYAGVIAIPAYPPRLNRNALRIVSIARDSGATLALSTREVCSRLPAIAAHTPELGEVRWIATDNLDFQSAQESQVAVPRQDGLAYLQYTSGSTADPKGVMISHANVLDNSRYVAKAFGHSEEDISVSWLPHFHDLGLVHGILQPLYSGFPGYLMAPMSFLQRPLDWLKAISRFRITHSDGPNFAYELCVNKIDEQGKAGLDLSNWRMALNGAEPVFAQTIERFTAAFAGCGFNKKAFYPAYGLAEATLVVSGGKSQIEAATCSVLSGALEQNKVVVANGSRSDQRILVGSGKFAPPMKVEIVDPESGIQCAPDEIGEIWVSGPSVALGYWNRPEETESIFRAKLEHSGQHFLRTGDLGFVHRGDLFITGRLKELIIVRGRNYYPQDIEQTAREACAGFPLATGVAFSVSIGTEERVVLVQELQRRQKVEIPEVFRRIRNAVAEEYELQLMEIVLVKAGTIPKTSSGKLQRRLCCREFLEGNLQEIARWRFEDAEKEFPVDDAALLADVDAIQNWLRSRIAGRVGLDPAQVDVSQPLVRFGLDSLGAVELAHDVQRKLGIVWQASAFLEDVTIADLAARAAEALSAPQVQIPLPSSRGDQEYPLSFGQQGLWFLHQLSPESAAYNIVQAIRITCEIDLPALRRSFQALVDRHASLRTNFAVADGGPVQRVRQNTEISFCSEDAGSWSEAQLNERLRAEAHKPFNLAAGPLFRIQVFSRSAREHVLLLTAHHIILDLWSLAQLIAELGVLYPAELSGANASLQSPASNYVQFVYWQKKMLGGERGSQLWSYWSKQLAGELPLLELPTDRARPAAQTYAGSSWSLKLNPELASKLKALSRRCSATLYMTLLAAFQVLLRAYTAEQEVVVGSPAAGRTRDEFASTVGYFVNPVVLRTTVLPDCPFEVFLRDHTRKTVLDALEHQDFPFAVLTERLQPVRDPRRSPVFQVMFAMQKAHLLHEQGLSLFALGESTARTKLGGLEMQSIALEQRIAQFDLSLVLAEAPDGIAAIFEYNTDLFEAATIGRMARHFHNLLENIVGNPEKRISCLSLFANAELAQVVGAAQPAGLPRAVPVHRMFEEQAARTPGATAIVFEGQQLSYRELNERANRLAHYLLRSAVRPGTRVAICLERSAEMIVSLLGAFKSGAVYVPLDPEYPRERLNFLLHDCEAEVLITRKPLLHPTLEGRHRVICLEAEEELIAQESVEDTAIYTDTNSFAYIIYTSGSTGLPKGVVVSHGALGNQMQWLAQEFPLDEHDRVLHKYSLSFDASLAEIFHALITGAGLVIARAGGQHDMRYLAELIRQHQVTEIDAVPTMLKTLFDEQEIGVCKSLRRVISGGEALSTEVQQRIYERLGPVELLNMYGPTESTITATFHRCSPEGNRVRVPIGIAIAETQIYVLDSSLQPVPIGVPGEIHIGGRSLACGYLNQPSLTAEKFIPDPFSAAPGARLYRTGDLGRQREDGVLEYLGRADRQVKIHGFRIELAEIEHELRKHGAVKDVAVVTRAHSAGENYIAAYVEPAQGQSITPARLRAKLSEILPRHLIPGAIVVLDRLPRLPSGKADVRALPEPASAVCEKGSAAPRNDTEAGLLTVWEQVLGRKNIGIYDNFFELGGDSILSIQAVARAREIGFELTPKQMFRFQTVADLAEVVGRNPTRQESFAATGGPFPLTPIQQWFFQQDLNMANQYTQSVLLEFDQALDLVCLRGAIQRLISRHDALRLSFEHTDAGWQQRTADPDSVAALEYLSLMHLSPEDQQKHAEAITADIRSGLDIANGPVIRAAYFDFGAGNAHRLLICIHHLAVDAVSWRILLDDLHRVYDQLTAGEKPAFAGTPIPFQRWAELLERHAKSEVLAQELAWWMAELNVPSGRLPIDHDGENTAASSATLRVSLSSAETGRLLRELPTAYRTEINDVFLAALGQVLANWTGNKAVLIDLEGHGREEIVDGVDPSGTVGWFTSVYPVLLQVRSEWGPAERLKSVKEHVRKIPGKGIGFGLLRYLCSDEVITGQLKAFPRAEVSFNYLGQLDQMCRSGSPFRVICLDGPATTSFGKRSHVLEIDAYVKNNALEVQWTYSAQMYHRNTIEALACGFLQELQNLVQHCASLLSDEYTTSDFPLVQLSERQLARIRQAHGAIEDIYPLSPMQQGMLFHSLYEPQKGTYLTQLICEFSGELDGAAFQGAWQAVIDNHSALRSEFDWEIVTEEPVQLTAQAVRPKWHFGNWSYAGPQEQSKLLERYLKEDRAQAMNLERAPLMRFALFAAGNSKHLFVWSSHHLLMDGWSLPLVLKNVFAAYNALSRGQWVHLQPERPYRDYIEWLRQQDFTAAEKFWRGSLQGFTTPTTLEALHHPTDRAVSSEGFCEYEVRLSESETAVLREFARDHRLTLSTVVYGVWALVLSRITGRNDLVFGAVVSGRQLPLARAGEMVGVFINTLPVRAKIEPAAHLAPWLKEMQDRQAEAARFEHSSLSSIQSCSELPRGVPLFDHILVFENYPAESWNQVSNELRIFNMRSLERSNYALTVWIVPGRQLYVKVGYDRLSLDSSKVTAVVERYGALLAAIGTLDDQEISELVRVHAHLPFAPAASPAAIAATRMPVESQSAARGFESTPVQFGELATAVTEPDDDTAQHVRAAYGSEGEEQKL